MSVVTAEDNFKKNTKCCSRSGTKHAVTVKGPSFSASSVNVSFIWLISSMACDWLCCDSTHCTDSKIQISLCKFLLIASRAVIHKQSFIYINLETRISPMYNFKKVRGPLCRESFQHKVKSLSRKKKHFVVILLMTFMIKYHNQKILTSSFDDFLIKFWLYSPNVTFFIYILQNLSFFFFFKQWSWYFGPKTHSANY